MLFINSENQVYSGDRQENDRQLTTDEESLFLKGHGFDLSTGFVVDITDTQEYKEKIRQEENQAKKATLQLQIDELDKRRIRAICEPEVKDEETGQTWLEYYTQQIQELREEIINLI